MTGEDRIKETIKKLKIENNYNVRVNASYYSDRVIKELTKRFGKDAKYVFYTRYASLGNFDLEGNLAGILTLDWQGDAEEIIEAFKEAGFSVEWAGSKDDLIVILPKEENQNEDYESKTIELDRYLYELRDNNYFLIIKNKKNDEIYYEGFKGSLDELWIFLGKKGAGVENKELLIDFKGKIENTTIEEYIEIYSKLFKEEVNDINDLFITFTIVAVGIIGKDEYEETIGLMGEEGINLQESLNLKDFEEDKSLLEFKKEIKDENDFVGTNQKFTKSLGWNVIFEIQKK